MSRLIDADALEAEFAGRPPDWYSTGTILRSIDSAPTIDAVPVVRCRECKYACKSSVLPLVICGNGKGLVDPRTDTFCSYGERKEAEHETTDR